MVESGANLLITAFGNVSGDTGLARLIFALGETETRFDGSGRTDTKVR